LTTICLFRQITANDHFAKHPIRIVGNIISAFITLIIHPCINNDLALQEQTNQRVAILISVEFSREARNVVGFEVAELYRKNAVYVTLSASK
jgi:hypothetical protein